MQNIPEILKKIANTNSLNEKKEILKETKSEYLEYIFKQVYDPSIHFNISKVTSLTYCDSLVDERWFDDLCLLLNKLENRYLTGNDARDEVRYFVNLYPKEWGEVVLNILKKDLRIGVSQRTINSVYEKLFPDAICMSAAKYRKDKVNFPKKLSN